MWGDAVMNLWVIVRIEFWEEEGTITLRHKTGVEQRRHKLRKIQELYIDLKEVGSLSYHKLDFPQFTNQLHENIRFIDLLAIDWFLVMYVLISVLNSCLIVAIDCYMNWEW
jgi:hypothetical protein